MMLRAPQEIRICKIRGDLWRDGEGRVLKVMELRLKGSTTCCLQAGAQGNHLVGMVGRTRSLVTKEERCLPPSWVMINLHCGLDWTWSHHGDRLYTLGISMKVFPEKTNTGRPILNVTS